MKAGLFDRAEAAYKALEGTAFDGEARLALLSLHERARDWRAATEVALELERRGDGSFATRIAHYACELALRGRRAGPAAAGRAGAAARARRPRRRRVRPLAADRPARWRAPASMRRRCSSGTRCWRSTPRPGRWWRATTRAARWPAPTRRRARAAARGLCGRARHRPAAGAGSSWKPSRRSASAWCSTTCSASPRWAPRPSCWSLPRGAVGRAARRQQLQQVVAAAARPLQRYRCAACGFEAHHYFWQCPGCQGWDTYPPQRMESL